MENVIKEVVEVPAELPVAEPEVSSGFPWCGTGIVLVVVAAALLGRKYCCKK